MHLPIYFGTLLSQVDCPAVRWLSMYGWSIRNNGVKRGLNVVFGGGVLIMEAYKGLIPATLVRILWQQIMKEGGKYSAQTAASAICSAVLCQDQACLRHRRRCESTVVACCYQRPCACSC